VDDDLTVLQRWRDGDARAGEDLCSRYFDEIYRFFEWRAGSRRYRAAAAAAAP
jgi:hypothetical protein